MKSYLKLKIVFFILSVLLVSHFSYAVSGLRGGTPSQAGKTVSEYLHDKYPNPPIGRWKAVYNKEFAEEHNLPSENISTDFSPGVGYMEMDVQPYGNGGVACLVNMLIKKPHDIALYGGSDDFVSLLGDRKLLHLLEIDEYGENLKSLITFSTVSRDYNQSTKGYRATTFAMYAEDVLPGYDYITANANCRDISMHPNKFPDGYALWAAKASIWGKYKNKFKNYSNPSNPEPPRGVEFYESNSFVNIPHELVSAIFKDVPIGGK